jgi:AbrB family looped-hinge helix DNA binding protein
MPTLSTTRMSSKGQVVIPEDIRKSLHLRPGAQFVVLGENGVVILKTISRPSMSDFNSIIAKARKQAKRAGLRKSDISRIVAEVRSGE